MDVFLSSQPFRRRIVLAQICVSEPSAAVLAEGTSCFFSFSFLFFFSHFFSQPVSHVCQACLRPLPSRTPRNEQSRALSCTVSLEAIPLEDLAGTVTADTSATATPSAAGETQADEHATQLLRGQGRCLSCVSVSPMVVVVI